LLNNLVVNYIRPVLNTVLLRNYIADDIANVKTARVIILTGLVCLVVRRGLIDLKQLVKHPAVIVDFEGLTGTRYVYSSRYVLLVLYRCLTN
jgi:hypothetical protein